MVVTARNWSPEDPTAQAPGGQSSMGRRRAERTSEALSGQARGQRLAARLVVRGWRRDEVAGWVQDAGPADQRCWRG
jgi:hypothetical protein